MLSFAYLEQNQNEFRREFLGGEPFPFVVIDDFCDEVALRRLCDAMPDPASGEINRSRDYVFAKNKYEKSGFRELSQEFGELYTELMSDRFKAFLCSVTAEDVFVDPDFHGGGIHQGGEASFLDMHVDFNTHPLHADWFRNLNILLYLNQAWKPEYRGELKIRHRDHPGSTTTIEPLFNRCVIMFTRDYTLHGYDAINFPVGQYRRSVAAYAYSSLADATTNHHTTVWYPEQSGAAKKMIGRHWPKLVKVKNALFGSATAKNK